MEHPPLHNNSLVTEYLNSRYFTGFELKHQSTKIVLSTGDDTITTLLQHAKFIKDDEELVELDIAPLVNKRVVLKKATRELRLQYEPESVDLLDALNTLHAFSDPAVKQRLNDGFAMYADMPVLFARGSEAVCSTPSGLLGGIVETCNEVASIFGVYFNIVLSVVLPTRKGCCVGKVSQRINCFEGKQAIDKLNIRPLLPADKAALTERGRLFREFTQSPTPASYSGNITIPAWFRDRVMGAEGRVMVDAVNFAQIVADLYYEIMHSFEIDEDAIFGVVNDDDLWRCYNRVQGFSMRLKRWGWLDVDGLQPVVWRGNAFEQLVLAADQKQIMLHLVEHYGNSFSDFIDGKSGGLVFLLHGPTGSGKAQPLDCLVQTPNGPVQMGEIRVGDRVLTPDGGSAKVLAVYPQGIRPCFELTFADGRKTKADADHLWRAKTEDGRVRQALGIDQPWDIVTTARLHDRVYRLRKSRIPLTNPIVHAEAELPLDPWFLGILLGDGFFKYKQISVSTSDEYIIERVAGLLPQGYTLSFMSGYDYGIRMDEPHPSGIAYRQGVAIHEVRKVLSDLGLYGCGSHERFVPALYFNASVHQRMELVRGMMDSDGYVGKEGSLSYASTSEQMAKDFQRLIWSLGGIASISMKETKYYSEQRGLWIDGRDCYNVNIRVKNPDQFVSLPRKKQRVRETNQYSDTLGLRVEKIERIEDQPTQCILIDHPDHLYLTDDYLVTHNTLSAEAVAETLHRPLYSISVGELGTDPGELEEKLRGILDLAYQWNAVLLLDEADIFMEARDTNNIPRNAMVSIFLRLLEYYSGVMFLTTNRVQTFDPAFFSRISLAIAYPMLDSAHRLKVWNNVLESADIQTHHLDVPQLAKFEVNGRNIKTVVRIVQTLAAGSHRDVRQDDFTGVLALTERFNREIG